MLVAEKMKEKIGKFMWQILRIRLRVCFSLFIHFSRGGDPRLLKITIMVNVLGFVLIVRLLALTGYSLLFFNLLIFM